VRQSRKRSDACFTYRKLRRIARGTGAYSQYIAFGDSFTSGFGLVDVARSPAVKRARREN
jgi:hypothetical protein